MPDPLAADPGELGTADSFGEDPGQGSACGTGTGQGEESACETEGMTRCSDLDAETAIVYNAYAELPPSWICVRPNILTCTRLGDGTLKYTRKPCPDLPNACLRGPLGIRNVCQESSRGASCCATFLSGDGGGSPYQTDGAPLCAPGQEGLSVCIGHQKGACTFQDDAISMASGTPIFGTCGPLNANCLYWMVQDLCPGFRCKADPIYCRAPQGPGTARCVREPKDCPWTN